MTEEPLHVQVARALGWTSPEYKSFPTAFHGDIGVWYGTPPPVEPRSESTYEHVGAIMMNIPREIQDYPRVGWAEILEREKYGLIPMEHGWVCGDPESLDYCKLGTHDADGTPYLTMDGTFHEIAYGPTPGEAVCKLYVGLQSKP